MPVDTQNKRAAVLGFGLAVTLTLPLADGAVDADDRPHVAYSYPGIAVASPIAPKHLPITSASRTRARILGSRSRGRIPASEN